MRSGNLVTCHRYTRVIRKIHSIRKRMTNIKKYASRKVLASMSVVLTVASISMTTVWQIPIALATSLEEIKVSREVPAPIDKVWNMKQNIGL